MSTLSLIVSLLSPILSPAQALPVAATLLDRREAALGPSEARAKVRGLEIHGRIETEGCDVACDFEELHLLSPGGERVLQTVRCEGWNPTTQGTDGRASWSTDLGFGITVKEGASSAPQRRLYALSRSTPWRSLYTSARTLGVVEHGGRRLYELEMQPAEGPSDRWYLTLDTNE